MDPTPDPQDRTIRLFVSSTFQDMQAEREELMKRVVPALVSRCRIRGVSLDVVDLRWGITVEDRDAGRLLPICLGEIDACRPFFIGLLGERYGWVPDDLAGAALADMPWLGQLQGQSITAIEIHHALSPGPGAEQQAFFYFRDPAWVRRQPADQRPAYVEDPQPEEVERFGKQEAERRAQDRRRRLQELKSRIRNSGLPLWDGYPNPVALGKRVQADLEALIDRLYPLSEVPGEFERERGRRIRVSQAHAPRGPCRGSRGWIAWLPN